MAAEAEEKPLEYNRKHFASELSGDDIQGHLRAVEWLKEVGNLLTKQSCAKDPSEIEIISQQITVTIIHQLTPTAQKKYDNTLIYIKLLCCAFTSFMLVIDKKNTYKNVSAKHAEKKSYNINHNRVFHLVADGSILKGLLVSNGQYKFAKPSAPKQPSATNILTLDQIGYGSEIVVTLSKGRRLSFGSYEEAQTYFRCALDDTRPQDLCVTNWSNSSIPTLGCCDYITVGKYRFSIDIPIKRTGADGRATTNLSFLNTSDSRLINILFQNKFPSKKNTQKIRLGCISEGERYLYRRFLEFEKLVEKKIYQLMNARAQDPTFDFVTMQCVRFEPKCDNIDVVQKSKLRSDRLHTCSKCNFQLCNVCGKPHHDMTDCDAIDEATREMISSTTKLCPGENCQMNIHKTFGCNHMTCASCKIQFCWVCLQEYEKDAYGHYDVDGHHSRRNEDGTLMCNQFPPGSVFI